MPFELFPASRNSERGKRKRGDDEDAAENRKDLAADEGKGAAAMATDEEVEEFFAILRRLHAATKYIEKIDGASHLLMGKRSKPSAEKADEIGIRGEKIPEHEVDLDRSLDLDLNLEPASVKSDAKDRRIRSKHPKPSSADSRK